jgi:hypothetical protein
MTLPTYYNTGTASVANGSTAVTGVGTSWVAFVAANDYFQANGLSVRILSVTDNTHLTLASPWPGSTLSGASYEVEFTPDGVELSGSVRTLLEALITGNIAALTIADGSAASPSLRFLLEPGTGLWRVGAGKMGLSVLGVNLITYAAGSESLYNSADAFSANYYGAGAVASPALNLNAYKSRGNISAPTAITSGDELLSLHAFGHDGGSYIEAGHLRFVSTGTIAANRVAANLEVWLHPNSTSALAKVLSVDSAGNLTVVGTVGVRDASAAFNVLISCSSSVALTADRTLTFDVVNAARTIKLTGNPTLADWFDQSVKSSASPSFAGVASTVAAGASFSARSGASSSYVKIGGGRTGEEFFLGVCGTANDIITGAQAGEVMFGTASGNTIRICNGSRGNAVVVDSSGHVYIGVMDTTVMSANVVYDNASSQQLLRSTSTGIFKTGVEPVVPSAADGVLRLQSVYYRSLASGDLADPARRNWSYYSFLAEDVARVDPRLVQYSTMKNLPPNDPRRLAAPTRTVEEEQVVRVTERQTVTRVVERAGKMVLAMEEVDVPAVDRVPLWHEDGSPVLVDAEDGGTVQATVEVPRKKTVAVSRVELVDPDELVPDGLNTHAILALHIAKTQNHEERLTALERAIAKSATIGIESQQRTVGEPQ